MKIRDSGMPEQFVWDGFFDAPRILQKLRLEFSEEDVVDIGCGFGTFSVAAARMTRGIVHALDIDSGMISATLSRARAAGLGNIKAVVRDVVATGTGVPDVAAGYVMLFNILHAEDSLGLLREAHRILRPGGLAALIHWVHEARTPRGPPLEIRPRPQQCQEWGRETGFVSHETVLLPPHHFGLVLEKPAVRQGA